MQPLILLVRVVEQSTDCFGQKRRSFITYSGKNIVSDPRVRGKGQARHGESIFGDGRKDRRKSQTVFARTIVANKAGGSGQAYPERWNTCSMTTEYMGPETFQLQLS